MEREEGRGWNLVGCREKERIILVRWREAVRKEGVGGMYIERKEDIGGVERGMKGFDVVERGTEGRGLWTGKKVEGRKEWKSDSTMFCQCQGSYSVPLTKQYKYKSNSMMRIIMLLVDNDYVTSVSQDVKN